MVTSDETESADSDLRFAVAAPSLDPDTFIEQLASERLEPGTELDGTFTITEFVGRGGMGVVYRAWHEALEREVAIKLCRRRASPRDTRRLLVEARAIAALAHPNVVVVHHVGQHAGQVFLVMEYVDGGSLRQWLSQGPRSWEEIVEKFVAAGRGLAAAHAAGLVHRDFKPDNVLLGRDGRARVADFGLVYASSAPEPLDDGTDRDDATRGSTTRGHIAGTLRYMAPEQHVAGPVTPAADQFSFAVALFEALAGAHPYAGDSAHQTAASIVSGRRREGVEPDCPRTIRRALQVAMAPDPAQRYPTMDALLRGLAVPTRRAPLLAATAAVVAGAAWVAASSSNPAPSCPGDRPQAPAWPADDDDRLRDNLAKSGLTDHQGLARRIDEAAASWIARWTDAEQTVCSSSSDAAWLALRRECLEAATIEFEALAQGLSGAEPSGLARALETFDHLPEPEQCTGPGGGLLSRPRPADPALARALASGRTAAELGDLDEAEAIASRVLADADDDATIAEAYLLRLSALNHRWQRADTTQTAERGLAAAIRAGADHVAAEIALINAAGATRAGDFEAARRWESQAEAWLARLGRPVRLTLWLDQRRGDRLARSGAFEEAVAVMRKAADAAAAIDPALASGMLENLAMTYAERGDGVRAQSLAREAIEMIETHLGPDHPYWAEASLVLAAALRARGASTEALGVMETACEAFRRTYDPRSRRLATCHHNLAVVYYDAGRVDDAVASGQRALELSEELGDEGVRGEASLNLSRFYVVGKDDPVGLEYAVTAVEVAERLGDPRRLSKALANLADLYRRRGVDDRVGPLLERAIEAGDGLESGDQAHAQLQYQLGLWHRDHGDLEAARKVFADALDALGDTRPIVRGDLELALGETQLALGLHAEARERLESIAVARRNDEGRSRLAFLVPLARARLAVGEVDAGLEATREALALARRLDATDEIDLLEGLLADVSRPREQPARTARKSTTG